ncbi:PHP domain-containing protein [bacterium]|nr:PHP domain-containing protein [bacterium]
MEYVDCHTHTRHSDGRGTIEENVARACALGLSTIACTDHFVLPPTMDPDCACSVPAGDAGAYLEDIRAAREAHPEIQVVTGWECDFYPGCERLIDRHRGDATFLLGSVHALDGQWIDDLGDLAYWERHRLEDVWTRYFEVWAQACACDVGFSSMAHPDLVSLRGLVPDDPALLRDLYESAASAAARAGVRVEVSSAGMRKPLGAFYPAPELLAAFCAHGVPITVGSDAHDPAVVGDRIADLYAYARRAGYTQVDVPTVAGGWRSIAL